MSLPLELLGPIATWAAGYALGRGVADGRLSVQQARSGLWMIPNQPVAPTCPSALWPFWPLWRLGYAWGHARETQRQEAIAVAAKLRGPAATEQFTTIATNTTLTTFP